jgi:hypothetical protein
VGPPGSGGGTKTAHVHLPVGEAAARGGGGPRRAGPRTRARHGPRHGAGSHAGRGAAGPWASARWAEGGAGAPARWVVGRPPGEPKMQGSFIFLFFLPVLALIHH